MSGSNHGNADVYDSDESEEKHEKTETLPRIPQHVRLTKRQSDEEKRESMSILQDEFSKFIKRHSDREDISKFSLEEPIRNKPFRDTIPLRSIPYGDKRKKGL